MPAIWMETPEQKAEFDRKYPLNTTIIFGAKPPRWWLEKYENASKQEPQAAKSGHAKPSDSQKK